MSGTIYTQNLKEMVSHSSDRWSGLVVWTGGLDWWSGLVVWTGFCAKNHFMLSKETSTSVGLAMMHFINLETQFSGCVGLRWMM